MTYLKFEEQPNHGKLTKIWNVNSASDGSFLGTITYKNTWRKYVFGSTGAIFDASCLSEILSFLIANKDARQ